MAETIMAETLMSESMALMGGQYSEHGLGFQSATTDGRKGFASVLSWVLHGLLFIAAVSGIIPSAPVIEPPPDMVVQMVIEPPPPPPPPPPQEAVEPQTPPTPIPEPVVKPIAHKVPRVHHTPKPTPAPPPPAPTPLATTPSPAPEAPALPPVSAPAPPPVASPAPVHPVDANPAPSPVVDGLGTKRYLAGIQTRAEQHLVYPPLSLRRGEQGEIHVHVKVTRSGEILDMDAGTEGTGRLRAAALAALRESAPFPPLPPSITGDPVEIVVPVQFTIN